MDTLLTPMGKVHALEVLMKLQPQVECKVIHHFSKGVYARELHIPAGVILTGEIHKFTNLNILSKGKIQVLVGDVIQELEAPQHIVSPAGTKRIARTLTECVWTTIHGTDEVDLNIIERTFIAKSEQEWLEFCGHNSSQLELGLG
jgi:hypothetical protein